MNIIPRILTIACIIALAVMHVIISFKYNSADYDQNKLAAYQMLMIIPPILLMIYISISKNAPIKLLLNSSAILVFISYYIMQNEDMFSVILLTMLFPVIWVISITSLVLRNKKAKKGGQNKGQYKGQVYTLH